MLFHRQLLTRYNIYFQETYLLSTNANVLIDLQNKIIELSKQGIESKVILLQSLVSREYTILSLSIIYLVNIWNHGKKYKITVFSDEMNTTTKKDYSNLLFTIVYYTSKLWIYGKKTIVLWTKLWYYRQNYGTIPRTRSFGLRRKKNKVDNQKKKRNFDL